MSKIKIDKIAVIGQGYVGLPLALELAKFYTVYGFDINEERVAELNQGQDHTLEADIDDLKNGIENFNNSEIKEGYKATSCIEDIQKANTYIVTVPTPIDEFNAPDLRSLKGATRMLAEILKPGDIVIYESTVYPGCTEEICVPILEDYSHLKFNKDFYVGYSPERIVPGDKVNTLKTIMKVTSGSNSVVALEIDNMYKKIVSAGTHLASSIKVAEASKVIENSQRDINIAFVNELAKIFGLMGINTADVLAAAKTKWNFLPFTPGLVGGHCIGVDPYYLAQRAEEFGYHPGIILAGRRMNEGMGEYVASQVIKLMIERDIKIKDAHILILGITFKENCPDVRNTRVVDVIKGLREYSAKISVYDPWADEEEVKSTYQIESTRNLPTEQFDAIILTVAHEEFKSLNYQKLKKTNAVVYDVKSILPSGIADKTL